MGGWLITAILAGLLLIACGWLVILHADIRKMTRQLHGIIRNPGTNERVRTTTHDTILSRYAAATNQLISVAKQEQQASRKRELEMKREITNISHDLRTPLTSLKGFSELLSAPSITEHEKSEYLAIVQKKIDHLIGTADLFYELSQLDSMDKQLMLERHFLDQMVIDTILTFREELEEKQLDVRVGDMAPMSVLADRKATGRIISNIIQNALAYSKSYLAIDLAEDEETVRLRIANDVEAFNTAKLELIFERTFRMDTSRSGGQLGLGLHIVRQLAEKQGGRVDAHVVDDEFILEVYFLKQG
ncbi:signal transduction histidine kinase [Sporosarcina luteola]|nr:signal transduction histidine kinase [Sporosarcina luteola]